MSADAHDMVWGALPPRAFGAFPRRYFEREEAWIVEDTGQGPVNNGVRASAQ